MKTKILVGYSTNRDQKFRDKFFKEIKKNIGCKFDVMPIYNSGSMSLTKTYNKIWETYPFDESYIFVFIHHDIHFKTNGWGKTLLNLFNNNPDTHIVGVAGTDCMYKHGVWWLDYKGDFNQTDLWGKVWHTDGKKNWKSDFTTVNKKCDKIQPVVALDGVLLAFDPDQCEQFDEDFDSFHFYDISFCTRNKLANKNIFVTETIQILHESEGPIGEEWDKNRLKYLEKYVTANEVEASLDSTTDN